MAELQTNTTAAGWRHFPQLERLTEGGNLERLLQKVELTCRRLDRIANTGQRRNADRAKAALKAYGLALELIKEIEAATEKSSSV